MTKWKDWQAWCESKQAAYEKSRARWRKLHPVADVKALEEKYGIKPTELSIEKLKAPALVIEDKASPEPKPANAPS